MVSLWNCHRENGARGVALLPRVLCSGSAGEDPSALFCALGRGPFAPGDLSTQRHSAPLSAGDFSAQDSFRAGSADGSPESCPALSKKGTAGGGQTDCGSGHRPRVVAWMALLLFGRTHVSKASSVRIPEASPHRRTGAQAQVPQRRLSVPRSDRPLVLGGMLTWAPRLSQFAVVQRPTRCVPCPQRRHPLWSPPAHLPEVRALHIPWARSLSGLKHVGFLTVGVT